MMQPLERKVLTRRRFAISLTGLSLGILGACSTTPPDIVQAKLAYVGMDGSQIRALRFDAGSGRLTMIGPVADVPRSRWAVAHPQLPVMYATSDSSTGDGSVIAFAVDRITGALTKLSEVSAGGKGTTHLWLDAPSMTLLAANFGGGSTSSISINRDGKLGALVSTIKATGSGPHRRQASPHAHGVSIDPSGRYALVPDLGADRVFVYRFDRTAHTLSPDNGAHPRSFVVPPGSGPHHLEFGLNGRFAYLLNELTADVMTLRWDQQQGFLTLVQTVPISSPAFQGTKSGSEIAVSRDGRFVYVSNRGENTLLVYRVNADSGELSLVQRTSCGGKLPWTFALHASGAWMLVANKGSNQVNVFRVDPASGMLSNTGQSVDTPDPVSIAFVK